MLIAFLQLKLIPNYGIPPARVDDIARPNVFGETRFSTSGDTRTRVPPEGEHRAISIEIDVLDQGFLAHFRARFRRVIQQHLVEFRSCHLIRTIGARTESILEVNLRGTASTGFRDLAPKFFEKAGT